MSQEIKNPCKLCLKKEADQTGSHLTSCFIVSSQIGERDNEKGFMITSKPGQDYSENLGAEGIKEDYILCTACEKRLSYVETYFSQEFTNKIDIGKYAENFPVVELEDENCSKFFQCNNVHPIAFHLLIYSIIWRASISNKPIFAGFSLEEDVLENLRFTLDLYLPEYKKCKIVPKLKNWLKDMTNVPDFFTIYPYVILRSEEEEINLEELSKEEREDWEKRKTKNLLYFAFEYNHPYHIILNEFIILPFFNSGDIDFATQDFFELNDKYDLNSQMNKTIEKPKVGFIKNEDWSRIHFNLYSIVIEQRLDNIRRQCIELYLLNGILPTKRVIDECVFKKMKEIKIRNINK